MVNVGESISARDPGPPEPTSGQLVTRHASVSAAQLATGGEVSRFDAPARGVVPVHPLMAALGQGLPITLLVDLIDPNGPRSFEMLEREGITADAEGYRAITAETASTA